MKNAKLLFYFLAFSLISFSCGDDDSSNDDNAVFFNADIDGQAFSTTTVNAQSVFGLHSLIVPKDNDEIQFTINGLELGTYEVGSADKTADISIGISHSSSSGSIIVTAYDETTRIIEGTMEGIVLDSGLPGVSSITIDNAEFKAKFIF